MFQQVILVFLGGAVGATLRELLMLTVPTGHEGFPYSIFVANVVASYVLGLTNSLHSGGSIGTNANLFVGTGLTGGMSTFSSFVYATFVLLTTSEIGVMVGVTYAVASLVIGFLAVLAGLATGGALSGGKRQQ
ncbi:CrcB family protein [Pseudorhizobium sp. NPDC055634]